MTMRRQRQPQRRRGCLGTLVALVWLTVAVVACYVLLLRPYISSYIGERLAEELAGPAASGDLPPEVIQALPSVVAALPPGEFIVTEQQANDYLQSSGTGAAQVESVQVRFVPDQVQADVRAAGTDNRVTMGLAVRDGRLVVVDPRIDGLIEAFVAPEQLVEGLTKRLNDELAAQGKPPTDVRIEQGRIIVTLGDRRWVKGYR